jgi:hypothetical protein
MHKDDNRANARADNLEYGTPLQNVTQCIQWGRWTRRKLTDAQAREIRSSMEAARQSTPSRRVRTGTAASLAQKYGVSERCIEAVWWGRNYAAA